MRVVVVGGGIVGLSVAFHLAPDAEVVVLERSMLGAGATGSATGGIRQQFSSPVHIALSCRSLAWWSDAADRLGEDVAFHQHGYLFLVDDEARLGALSEGVERQRLAGIEAEVISPDDVARLMPCVDTTGLAGATWCPTDGSADPNAAVRGLARAARRGGVEIRQGVEVAGFVRDGGGAVIGVRTAGGDDVAADAVVLATGPWTGAVAASAGVDLPVRPVPRQAFVLAGLSWLDPGLPLTVDLGTGAYLHPVGPYAGGTDRGRASSFDAVVDPGLTEDPVRALVARFPRLAGAGLQRGWCGLREMTPDDHGLLGPVPDAPGLWVAAGFSGHGFMHAPAVADVLARWLTTGAPDLDVATLAPDRFARDAATVESTAF